MESHYCSCCKYQAKNKYSYKRHLTTKKHAKNLILYDNETSSVSSDEIVYGSDQEDDEEYECPEGEQDDLVDELLDEEY